MGIATHQLIKLFTYYFLFNIFFSIGLAGQPRGEIIPPIAIDRQTVGDQHWNFLLKPQNLDDPPVRVIAEEGLVVDKLYQLKGNVYAVKKHITGFGNELFFFRDQKILRLMNKPWIEQHLPATTERPARLLRLKAETITWDEVRGEFLAERNGILQIFPYSAPGVASSTPLITIFGDTITATAATHEVKSIDNARIQNPKGFAQGYSLTYFDIENMVKISGTLQQPGLAQRQVINLKTATIDNQTLQGDLLLYDLSEKSFYSE